MDAIMEPNTVITLLGMLGGFLITIVKLQSYINEKFNKLDRRIVRVETHLNIKDSDG